jgi:hypothetical protein
VEARVAEVARLAAEMDRLRAQTGAQGNDHAAPELESRALKAEADARKAEKAVAKLRVIE